jgi:hypothetical protein
VLGGLDAVSDDAQSGGEALRSGDQLRRDASLEVRDEIGRQDRGPFHRGRLGQDQRVARSGTAGGDQAVPPRPSDRRHRDDRRGEPGRDLSVPAQHLDLQLDGGAVDVLDDARDVGLIGALGEEQRRQHADRPGAHGGDVVAGDVDGVPAGRRSCTRDRVGREHADLVAERDGGGVLPEPGVHHDIVAPHPQPIEDDPAERRRIQFTSLQPHPRPF